MRADVAALLALLGLLAAADLSAPCHADDDPVAAILAAAADLDSRDASERLDALERLEVLLVDHPDAGVSKRGARCLARLKAILKRRGADERLKAVTVVALIPGAEALALWLERLDPEVEEDAAVLAASVAGAQLRGSDRQVERALLGGIRAGTTAPDRRALLLEALGHVDGPAALMVLSTGRKDEPWVEAAGRALGLGHRRDEASLGRLVKLVGHTDLGVRIHAWECLTTRSGVSLPPDPDAWRAWWAERQQPKPKPSVPAPKKPDDRYAKPKHVHVPTYYEVPIPRPGTRVVFCLDVSQSMYGDGIDAARRHLTKTLKDLPSSHAFDVIAFNEKVFPHAGRPIPAHPVQKWRAIRWLYELEPTSYTNIYDSVETAFQYMGRGTKPAENPLPLDMVFLLSDGAPNRGRYRNDDLVVKHIGRLSRRDVPVHTIGAGERVKGLLERISIATGGVFVDAFE